MLAQANTPRNWIWSALLVAGTSSLARAADEPLTFRGSLTWINAVTHTEPTESDVNPDNLVLRLPDNKGASEFWPNLKIGNSKIMFIIRPRVRYEVTRVKVDDKSHDPESSVDSTINEAYGQWTVSDRVSFIYGRQSYQWGAAEAISPSNRLFHEIASQRDILYEVRGKNIARLNLSLGKSFSTVIMTEYEENKDETAFIQGELFQSTGLLKSELSWHDGVDYFGVVFGGHQHGRPWVGEYFSINAPFFDGLSAYADASQQRGSDAWYPVTTTTATPVGVSTVTTFEHTLKEDDQVKNLAVGGLKYDFVNGSILRAEYILNQAGYTKEQHDEVLDSFRSKNPLQLAVFQDNLARLSAPGIELPGQRFAYASLHVANLFTINDLTLFTRATRSLTDGSQSGYVSLDYRLGDHGTLSGAVSGSKGEKDSELRGYSAPTETIAYRHDW